MKSFVNTTFFTYVNRGRSPASFARQFRGAYSPLFQLAVSLLLGRSNSSRSTGSSLQDYIKSLHETILFFNGIVRGSGVYPNGRSEA